MAFFSILLRRDVLTIVSALIIGPFLFFFLTTWIFYNRARSKAKSKTPPTVPFYIPGVFHALSLMTSGPQVYFAELLKELGDFAPFIIRIGPKPYVILRDPSHIAKVLKSHEQFDPLPAHVDVLDKLYGMPESAAKRYLKKQKVAGSQASLPARQLTTPAQDLHDSDVSVLAGIYVSNLSRSLNDKMFQVGTWTQIEDVWSFFQQVITRCMIETLFGTDLVKKYPKVLRDIWAFSNAAEDFLPGMPRYMVTTAATTAREQLHEGIEKWLKANHSGSEFARIGDEDPDVDDLKGSKFIQRRDHVLADMDGIDIKARIADMLNVMHDALSDVVPWTIWSLIEALREPQLTKDISRGIATYRPSHDATWNVAGVASLPLMQSVQAETYRLRIATALVCLGNDKSIELDQNWSLPPYASMLAFGSDMAQNSAAWAKARPSTAKRSFEAFWGERFLVQGREVAKLNVSKSGGTSGKGVFSIDGLDDVLVGRGKHANNQLGTQLASNIHAATLAVLLGEFEVQPCEVEAIDAAIPLPGGRAYGTVKPLAPIAARIRKRTPASAGDK